MLFTIIYIIGLFIGLIITGIVYTVKWGARYDFRMLWEDFKHGDDVLNIGLIFSIIWPVMIPLAFLAGAVILAVKFGFFIGYNVADLILSRKKSK